MLLLFITFFSNFVYSSTPIIHEVSFKFIDEDGVRKKCHLKRDSFQNGFSDKTLPYLCSNINTEKIATHTIGFEITKLIQNYSEPKPQYTACDQKKAPEYNTALEFIKNNTSHVPHNKDIKYNPAGPFNENRVNKTSQDKYLNTQQLANDIKISTLLKKEHSAFLESTENKSYYYTLGLIDEWFKYCFSDIAFQQYLENIKSYKKDKTRIGTDNPQSKSF
jgi:hypothetical protein